MQPNLRAGRAPGLWRRTPPAIFPPVMGLFGLGLAWRDGAGAFGLGAGISDAILGAVTLLYLFCLLAYAGKVVRRVSVVTEDMSVLPGRAGLAAMTLSALLLAAVLLAYSAAAARAVLWLGLALQAGLAGLALRRLVTAPAEQRSVTPVWHLSFAGALVAPLAAQPLGYHALSVAIFWAMLALALVIWAASAAQLRRARVPAPLRPLLVLHIVPAALATTVAAGLDMPGVALAFGALSVAMAAAMGLGARWLTASGFSPLWGAIAFPLAAFADACFALERIGMGAGWRIGGGLALIAATLIVPVIAGKVLQQWAKGQLGPRTNAATA